MYRISRSYSGRNWNYIKRHVPQKTHAHEILIFFYIICTEFCRYVELFSTYGQYDDQNVRQCTEQLTRNRGSSHRSDEDTKCIGNTKDDSKDQRADRIPVSEETDTESRMRSRESHILSVHWNLRITDRFMTG